MILFFGYGDDSALDRAVSSASERGLDHFVVDQRRGDFVDLVLESAGARIEGRLSMRNGAVVPLSEITAAYARPLTPVGTRDLDRGRTLAEGLLEWLDVSPARVVNRPSAMSTNSSKPFQAQEIAAAGLTVPDTLVSSNVDEVHAFWRRHGQVVFKSISGVRSIVKMLDEARARDLARIRGLPTQFQEYVPGVDVRVHVIGERIFATQISSRAIDYRYARQDGLEATLVPADLPDEIAARCIGLSARLSLPFCGIDLRRRPDGSFVCFEVNPMPGYSYFEAATAQPISSALVDYLADRT